MSTSNFSLVHSKTKIEPIYQLAKQVLVIDSSPLSIKQIADEIIDLNHIYLGSVSRIEELEKVMEHQEPDCLLINCNLKGNLNGFQLAKIIKLDYDVPFYMLCDGNDCETQKWMSELNPDGFIYLKHFAKSISAQLDIVLR